MTAEAAMIEVRHGGSIVHVPSTSEYVVILTTNDSSSLYEYTESYYPIFEDENGYYTYKPEVSRLCVRRIWWNRWQ